MSKVVLTGEPVVVFAIQKVLVGFLLTVFSVYYLWTRSSQILKDVLHHLVQPVVSLVFVELEHCSGYRDLQEDWEDLKSRHVNFSEIRSLDHC